MKQTVRAFDSISKDKKSSITGTVRLLDRKTNTSVTYELWIDPDRNGEITHSHRKCYSERKLNVKCYNKKLFFNDCACCETCKYMTMQTDKVSDFLLSHPNATGIVNPKGETIADVIGKEVSPFFAKRCFAGDLKCEGCIFLETHCFRCIVIPSIPGSDFCAECNDKQCILCYDNKQNPVCFCGRPDDDEWPICHNCRAYEHPICSQYIHVCSKCQKKVSSTSFKQMKTECKSCPVTAENMICPSHIIFSCEDYRKSGFGCCTVCNILYDKKNHPPDCATCATYEKLYYSNQTRIDLLLDKGLSYRTALDKLTKHPLQIMEDFEKVPSL
ncbi:MAG: hypothetical protein Harvfovirus35_13 [Harvfovirus sp.]|uniref:Uncharacterized protein n=1 Tax=Harvfovirus sp. TaxID=2487768 RepID=A0A3G5A4P8_9VIRU|nr:MAG: hypothetical protein Harvfovirus35_13 [Harvfovirus sp.]